MKYLKNIVAVLVLVGIFNLSYSAELSVDEIKVIDANTLNVTLSENPNLEIWEIDGEIRVLNDVKLRGAFASETETTEVELILEDSLKADTTYSLLTVLGADGSIDFTTPSNVEWFSALNISSVEVQDIDSIEVIDDRTIIVNYRDAITSSSLEYKLLAESEVIKIEKPDFYSPEIIISIEPPFTSEKDYILMFIEMQDASGEFLEFDTLNVVEVQNLVENKSNGEDIPELEAAGDETWLIKDKEMLYTEEVATMVTQTPQTGAASWVLVLVTLLINSFYYLSRKKKVVLA